MLRSVITKKLRRLSATIRPSALLMLLALSASSAYTRPVPYPNHSGPTVTLRKIRDLNFGGAFTGTTSGTVIVNPNGSRSATGGVTLNTASNIHAAEPAYLSFTIYNDSHCRDYDHCHDDDDQCDRHEGDDNHTNYDHTSFTRHGSDVTLALPSSDKLYKTGSSSIYMTADNFKLLRTNGYFTVGATLHVNANQATGSYSGSFPVTVVCE